MLQQLLIRNFALIEEMIIPFHPGLTVLSGETGAGKSIVVDAVSLVLGGKADRDMVRHGTDKAYVEGTFDIEGNQALLAYLQNESLDVEDNVLIISREINATGRTTSRVNGTLINLQVQKTLASLLMEIHGQHEHQALLSEENHILFLDTLGDSAYENLVMKTSDSFALYKQYQREYETLIRDNEYRQERLDRLYKQQKELEKANLQPGEEEELVKARDFLRNTDKINRGLQSACSYLSEGNGQQEAALQQVKLSVQALQEMTGIQDTYDALTARLDALYYDLEDIAYALRKNLSDLDLDGAHLDGIEARLDVVRRMEKKYGTSIAEVLEYQQKITEEISRFESLDEHIEQQKAKAENAYQQFIQTAQQLSKARHTLAKETEEKIDHELSHLNMPSARFTIQLQTEERGANNRGIDKVRFFIAANKGEEAKPLSKTASGGELSRIMLAIKSVASEKTMVSSMVFDEIDTGISGKTAAVVAEKMWDIARYRQVICVTHLQQIAAMASSHALVRKYEEDNRTKTEVVYMNEESRIEEISRLLGETREKVSSGAQHALSLLKDAALYREKHSGHAG